MIQDIHPHLFDNLYRSERRPVDEDVVFHFIGHQVLLYRQEQEAGLPLWKHLCGSCSADSLIPLFSIDNRFYFLTLTDYPFELSGLEYLEEYRIRHERELLPQADMFALFTAIHLHHWYASNRFCGKCGGEMKTAVEERRLDCCSCGASVYPRINPAVIVGVTNGNQLLITRYARNRRISVDALVAGFCEIGETLEETVRREVREETGLEVTNLRYYKSQPWGLADDLLAGFYCDVKGDPDIHLDPSELSTARWVPRREITGQPNQFSLTNEMMLTFRDGKEPH